MTTPRIDDALLRDLAVAEGVCARPILNRVTDTVTGTSQVVPIRCGSTREAVCPSCARRNRLLRMAQCREGWHLDHEPDDHPDDDPRASSSWTDRTTTPTTRTTRDDLQDADADGRGRRGGCAPPGGVRMCRTCLGCR